MNKAGIPEGETRVIPAPNVAPGGSPGDLPNLAPGAPPEAAQDVSPQIPPDARLALLCKALSHPVRVAILRRLAAIGGCVCGEIVDVLPLAQSTVSQHLKILKESGLVRGQVDGPRVCYCVDREVLALFKELAGGL